VLHLMKLAVGIRDTADLAAWQATRARQAPPLRHRTRNFPRRAAEIIAGGSIYWIISGAMVVRQRVVDIVEDRWEDGSKCAALILDPALVAVNARVVKPFQGWRYLAPADAPADVAAPAGRMRGVQALPEDMARELRSLCLI